MPFYGTPVGTVTPVRLNCGFLEIRRLMCTDGKIRNRSAINRDDSVEQDFRLSAELPLRPENQKDLGAFRADLRYKSQPTER